MDKREVPVAMLNMVAQILSTLAYVIENPAKVPQAQQILHETAADLRRMAKGESNEG